MNASLQLSTSDTPEPRVYEFEPGKFWLVIGVGDFSVFMPGSNLDCVTAARKLAEAVTRGADEIAAKLEALNSQQAAPLAVATGQKGNSNGN